MHDCHYREFPEAEEGCDKVNGRWLLRGAPSRKVRLRQGAPVIAAEYRKVLGEVSFVRKRRKRSGHYGSYPSSYRKCKKAVFTLHINSWFE